MHYWSTGQVSKKRNLSSRTLRYYDQINLLTPSYKDEHGKRFYSEQDLFRLEKILVLKSIGMPLEEIQLMLHKLSYKQILVSHYNHLQIQLAEIENSIKNTSTLLNMMELDETIAWEKVISLIELSKQAPNKWKDFFHKEENDLLDINLPSLRDNDPITAEYMSILKKIENYIATNIQPISPEGYDIAKKLLALSNETFQGNVELEEKFWAIRTRPAEETGLFPISQEVLTFVEQCVNYYTESTGDLK